MKQLSPVQMIEDIEEAKAQGFISDHHQQEDDPYDPIPCNNECMACPASKACGQLSSGSYQQFIANYNRLYSNNEGHHMTTREFLIKKNNLLVLVLN